MTEVNNDEKLAKIRQVLQLVLDINKVLDIRHLIREGLTRKVIAKKYGVSISCITKIHLKETWGWILEEELSKNESHRLRTIT